MTRILGDEFNLILSNSFDTRVLSRQNGAVYSGFDLRGGGVMNV